VKAKPFVLFVPAGGLGNASARTRVYAYLPHLQDLGFRWHVASYTYHRYDVVGTEKRRLGILEKTWLELLPVRNLAAFLRADVLFFQKKSIKLWMVRAGKMLGKRIIYDLDDALYFKPPVSSAAPDAHQIGYDDDFLPRLQWILKRCDLALVSGEELARFVGQYARSVKILPSVLTDVAEHPSVPVSPPVIGWVGAPENQRYLRDIEPTLRRIQDERPEVEVWLITSRLMDPPPRFKFRHVPWSLEAEHETIPQFTVGIAPLAYDPWCRAKMNFKALVYLSYGVPAVISPVGFPMVEFEEGRSILAARTQDDWYRLLMEVIGNPGRRTELALAGMAVVLDKFTAKSRAKEFVEALTGTATKSGV
jgi:hypothetical protein